MSKRTRRQAIGLAASGAAAAALGEQWIFAELQGEVVKQSSTSPAAWSPRIFDAREAEALARLVETLIPRTDTPGARDARVHEYIDLAVSLEVPKTRKAFVRSLRWLDKRCRKTQGADLVAVSDAELAELLRTLSDDHASHPDELATGVAFFADLKRRTIFGYYTSLEGRVEELGLQDVVTMHKWSGCRHPSDDHES
ncbi:MAG: gluconate 2-dehydrogenase subunit 3 family protein [Acidobacteriota bacterium]|nr:gluconate 2-dehydrogenase subunit 3 family protein [Acidobacteriota bacterium]